LSGKDTWLQYCEAIHCRTWEVVPKNTVDKVSVLKTQIFKLLTQANDEGKLKTKLYEIHNLLKLEKSTQYGADVFEILGGQRNFKRLRDIPHFERADGCWFDFAILIDQKPKPAEILGLNFEIRFPEAVPVQFLRFDLNLPGHNNQDRGMRFHLHPGSDDLMVHSPPMSPLEILHLFLYGLPIPEKLRSKRDDSLKR
jgi:hypothetical protein